VGALRIRQRSGPGAAIPAGHDHQPSRPDWDSYQPLSDNPALVPTVSVVIPVKNEARNIPMTLNSLPDWVDEVVLVDGHSADDTIAVARQCRPGIKVVIQPETGKGDAVLAGFKACGGDIIVMMDGDGSTLGSEIPRFVSALLRGADYAKGSRCIDGGGSDDITPARRLGNWLLSGLVNLTFGTRYTDLCYGYNALWSRHLPVLNLDCHGFEIETVMNIRAAKAALRVQEVPSYEAPRVHGESNLRLFADGWRILKAITAEAIGPSRHAGRPATRPAPIAASSGLDLPGHPLSGEAAKPFRSALPGLISVVICAHTMERWSETCAAVESVRTQSFQNREIIVVVDHHPDLQVALADALPDATVVENHEERGLSGARNTGVSVAQGDVVAFLDDDAVADADWLKFLADSYADPAIIGVGGHILPNWQKPRPSWFPAEFYWVVGCTYRGMPESRLPVRNLLGANASFRREAFELAGGFRNGIGRSAGKRPLGCEETEFCIRLSQRSPRSVLLFDNRAVVRHLVPADRSRFCYFRARCYAEGLSKAMVTASVGVTDGLAAERRYTTRTLPTGVARAVADLLRGDWSGLGRAGAIIAGLAATATGYAVGAASSHGRSAGRRNGS
jgi:glucosyl-dolichyl phosphate glucuronosyltransferase